jgi:hypothetical protein
MGEVLPFLCHSERSEESRIRDPFAALKVTAPLYFSGDLCNWLDLATHASSASIEITLLPRPRKGVLDAIRKTDLLDLSLWEV